MSAKTQGRPRRVPWSALPAGQLLTMQQAAALLQITRKTLVSEYVSGRRPIPQYIEIVTDAANRRTMIFRHTERG